ncbi:MAG: hypothetical protein ABFD97_23545 [Syntrophobacter sp.]
MFRNIVHIAIPDFCAAMEELRQPELRRCPLVLATPGERSVIQGVNGIARKEGIAEGMPLCRARRLCRRVRTVPTDHYYYLERHQEVVREFARFSPLVEGTHPGGYFIDITGTRRLWGPEPDIACRMEKDLARKVGLHARIGLASNKLVSQVAAHCVEDGNLTYIFHGNEESFFAPLSVHFLPGIGQATASRLAGFNIQKIGQLTSFSVDMLSGVFGRAADRLLKIARGIDPAPVLPLQQTDRLSLTKTLARDEIDLDRLESVLFKQIEEAGWNLREHNRNPGWLKLGIRYADGTSAESRKRLSPTAIEADQWLFQAILPLFLQLFKRRVAVRGIVLEFSDLAMPFRQLSFFPWERKTRRDEAVLQKALDRIRLKFGKRIISWGKAVQLNAN